MSKIQKQEIERLPLSDWEIYPWTKEMYQRHDQDFQNILKEYREIKNINGNAIMSRYIWLERKGALLLFSNEKGGFDIEIIEKKYFRFSNMFDRFSDWLSQKEKREMSEQEMKDKISDIKSGIKKADFSIPAVIREGANRDVEYEEQKSDDMIQDALNNF